MKPLIIAALFTIEARRFGCAECRPAAPAATVAAANGVCEAGYIDATPTALSAATNGTRSTPAATATGIEPSTAGSPQEFESDRAANYADYSMRTIGPTTGPALQKTTAISADEYWSAGAATIDQITRPDRFRRMGLVAALGQGSGMSRGRSRRGPCSAD